MATTVSISNEREILKQYYDKQGLSGFDYAFRYPGINKVLQAAGRVIRTQEDRGIIVLLDERFLQSDYNALYPREWKNRIVGNVETVDAEICKFWENTKDVLEIKKNPSRRLITKKKNEKGVWLGCSIG